MFKLCWQKKKVKPLHYSDISKMDILVHVNGNFIKKKKKKLNKLIFFKDIYFPGDKPPIAIDMHF